MLYYIMLFYIILRYITQWHGPIQPLSTDRCFEFKFPLNLLYYLYFNLLIQLLGITITVNLNNNGKTHACELLTSRDLNK